MNKIVVIAHNKHKSDLCEFLNQKSSWFYGREIIATGRTAEFLEKNNQIMLVGTWARVLDNEGNLLFYIKHPTDHNNIKRKMYLTSQHLWRESQTGIN